MVQSLTIELLFQISVWLNFIPTSNFITITSLNLSPIKPENMNRKCKTLTLAEKLKILTYIETQQKVGAKPNFTKIASDYGVHRTSISRVLKEKETLMKRSEEETQPSTSKRKRGFKQEQVDEALYLWVQQKLKQHARLNNSQLTQKATELATAIANEPGEEFVPSNSWINRFKARHGMVYKKDQGEGQHNDNVAEAHYRSTTLQTILENYNPEDIYNTDETGLYPKGLPDLGVCKKEERLKGSKKVKDRLTVLLTSNMRFNWRTEWLT